MPNEKPDSEAASAPSDTRQKFRKMLPEGKLDDKEIELELQVASIGVEIMTPPGMEEMTSQLQGMFQNLAGTRKRSRKLKIKDALKMLVEEEAAKMIDDEEIKIQAVNNVEQNGIVFLDELDKVTRRSDARRIFARSKKTL